MFKSNLFAFQMYWNYLKKMTVMCQKQKISGYFFVVSLLFLVTTFTDSATTEDILDPDLAAGLVALQPVLKDHDIKYR